MPSPSFGRRDDASALRTPRIGPSSSQGLAVSLCCDSHHTAIAPTAPKKRIATLKGSAFLGGPHGSRLVLGYEILRCAGHVVIVSPAVDHRQLLAPVAMPRWGFGGRPLQRGGPPGMRAGG